MSFNPYAAPESPAAQQQAPTPQGQGPQPWDATDAIGTGWRLFGPNAAIFMGAVVIHVIIYLIISWVFAAVFGTQMTRNFDFSGGGDFQRQLEKIQAQTPIYTIGNILLQGILTAFFSAGFNKMYLAAARGQPVELGTIFSGGSRFLPMFGLHFCLYFLKVLPPVRDLGGLVLGPVASPFALLASLIPYLIMGCFVCQAEFFVVDQNMGPIDALKASFSAARGNLGQLILFWCICGVMLTIGAIPCCLGWLLVWPLMDASAAVIYTRVTGTGGGGGFAGYGAPPGMPGGWGPPPGGGYGGPPPGYGPPPGGGYGGPPPGGFGGPPQGGYGGPPPGGNPYGGAPPGGNPYGPPGGGNPYGPR